MNGVALTLMLMLVIKYIAVACVVLKQPKTRILLNKEIRESSLELGKNVTARPVISHYLFIMMKTFASLVLVTRKDLTNSLEVFSDGVHICGRKFK